MKRTKALLILVVTIALFAAASVWTLSKTNKAQERPEAKNEKPLVTFVELGSVKCIPCRQMQPVMKSIGEKYGSQVSIVFHDVWKSDQRQYAEQYGIRVIPTQVFLDKEGKEFHRHEGFYPEAEIDKLLQERGLKVRAGE